MNELGHIMMIKLEMLMRKEMLDVFQITGDEIIHANDIVTFLDESIAQMRPQKSGSTGNKHALHGSIRVLRAREGTGLSVNGELKSVRGEG
jgi:hypothetical protein